MLSSVALVCPQCAAPLPRVARWRTVQCSYCGATCVRGEDTVERASFRAALTRAQVTTAEGRVVMWRSQRLRVLLPLGQGTCSEVLLAERLGVAPERVTLKLARGDAHGEHLAREHEVLRALQAVRAPGAAYFSRRLPQPIGVGVVQGMADGERHALLLRHPPGHWGSLADVMLANPDGIDPRHAVWLWRRMLEVLGFVHSVGWTHGCLAPEHALVHPRDHGVLCIGWANAQHAPRAPDLAAQARDLQQTAWTVRSVLQAGREVGVPGLGAGTPAPLAQLLLRCSEDASACAALGAAGLQAELSVAAEASFGAPQFVHFNPAPNGA